VTQGTKSSCSLAYQYTIDLSYDQVSVSGTNSWGAVLYGDQFLCLTAPFGITCDQAGNVYISDNLASSIELINSADITSYLDYSDFLVESNTATAHPTGLDTIDYMLYWGSNNQKAQGIWWATTNTSTIIYGKLYNSTVNIIDVAVSADWIWFTEGTNVVKRISRNLRFNNQLYITTNLLKNANFLAYDDYDEVLYVSDSYAVYIIKNATEEYQIPEKMFPLAGSRGLAVYTGFIGSNNCKIVVNTFLLVLLIIWQLLQ